MFCYSEINIRGVGYAKNTKLSRNAFYKHCNHCFVSCVVTSTNTFLLLQILLIAGCLNVPYSCYSTGT